MAKFSEVLGGIAKDLIQLQVTSDLASIEVLSHYKDQEFLKYLDSPRFQVSDIKLNLKFAIAEDGQMDQTDSSIKYVEDQWLVAVKVEAFENIPAAISGLSEDDKKKVSIEFEEAAKKVISPNFDMKSALSGQKNTTVKKSTNYVIDTFKKLSPETRRKLGKTTDFRRLVTRTFNSVLEKKLPSIKKVASAKSAAERDIEIVVVKSELEKIADSQLHEISFNLTPDFIKLVQEEEIKTEA